MNARIAIKKSIALLSPQDRRKLTIATVLQMATAFFDLAGVLLLGLVAVVAVSISSDTAIPSVMQTLFDNLGLSGVSPEGLVVGLGVTAAALLVLKSFVALIILRRVTVFLARRAAFVSAVLCANFLACSILVVQRLPSQLAAYAMGPGVTAAIGGVLGAAVVIASEIALLALLSAGLMFVDPVVCVATIAYFGLLALFLQRRVGRWAAQAGAITADAEVRSTTTVQEAMNSYRELLVSDRRDFYRDRFRLVRLDAARGVADSLFIAQMPKYVLEAALVVGGVLLTGSQMLTQDADAAIATLAVFLAAGMRVLPSIVRLQAAFSGIRTSAGGAEVTYELAETLRDDVVEAWNPYGDGAPPLDASLSKDRASLAPVLEVSKVSVAYPGSDAPALRAVSVSIGAGGSLALVGSTGAGKSTLADLILGVLDPDEGSVTIGGRSPRDAATQWPGAIAYVPQAVALANGSVRENVALGLPPELIDDARVWEALERAKLSDFLNVARDGLDTPIGENGVRLSGGQRQRLGIARALYTRPDFLVLDEATSALDAETEHAISETLRSLAGDVTTVTIAHRLATIRHADVVVYLEDGEVVATGTFDEVRAVAPSFDRQANLLGL